MTFQGMIYAKRSLSCPGKLTLSVLLTTFQESYTGKGELSWVHETWTVMANQSTYSSSIKSVTLLDESSVQKPIVTKESMM